MADPKDTNAPAPSVPEATQQAVGAVAGETEQKRSPYSATVIQHGRHPGNLGVLDPPDAFAILTGWCGEVMAIFMRLNGDRIEEATFMADGCLSTMACGDMVACMVRGLSLEEARHITPGALIETLDGLPEWSVHCAELAVSTLHQAIDNIDTGSTS